jgi:hypothetical protein
MNIDKANNTSVVCPPMVPHGEEVAKEDVDNNVKDQGPQPPKRDGGGGWITNWLRDTAQHYLSQKQQQSSPVQQSKPPQPQVAQNRAVAVWAKEDGGDGITPVVVANGGTICPAAPTTMKIPKQLSLLVSPATTTPTSPCDSQPPSSPFALSSPPSAAEGDDAAADEKKAVDEAVAEELHALRSVGNRQVCFKHIVSNNIPSHIFSEGAHRRAEPPELDAGRRAEQLPTDGTVHHADQPLLHPATCDEPRCRRG